jgi:signal transduction histidine kinase
MTNALATLRGLPLLADLPPPDLERIARIATRRSIPEGAVLMREGTEGDGLYILIDGELEVTRREGAGDVVLAVLGPGAFLGEMSLVERAPRNATVTATRPSEVLVLGAADFRDLLEASPAAALIVVRTFANRLRSTEAALLQSAKLASLGTLAAGLAHELNNPAAALSRTAEALGPAVAELERRARRLGQLGLPPDLTARADPPAAGPTDYAALNRAEDELTTWLEAGGVDRASELAPPLAACGWTSARLNTALAGLDRTHADAVLHWLAASCALDSLVAEARTAARSISDVVAAVRAHTHLGQAPVQTVDLVAGLESTVRILATRLKGIRLDRDFEPGLPQIEAYGGELNQVWANLMDNAAQALDGNGTIRLRAATGRDGVLVSVEDDGPGIPQNVLPRIFDPFYTTKPFGSGTGLGLHIAYTIVRRHRGRIHVDSRPGRTIFTVELPLRLSRA